jgi:hypothetical protein
MIFFKFFDRIQGKLALKQLDFEALTREIRRQDIRNPIAA